MWEAIRKTEIRWWKNGTPGGDIIKESENRGVERAYEELKEMRRMKRISFPQ